MKLLTTIILIIFWDFLMFYQIFLSPQVKRCMIITYKHGTYELLHELPNDLRLNISPRHFHRWGEMPWKKICFRYLVNITYWMQNLAIDVIIYLVSAPTFYWVLLFRVFFFKNIKNIFTAILSCEEVNDRQHWTE